MGRESETAESGEYGLGRRAVEGEVPAPELSYRPRALRGAPPEIALIGCGGIAEQHLGAYRSAGYPVVALCDRSREKAEARRREFFPDARVYADHRALLAREAAPVVDAVTHSEERLEIVADALRAGRHVLSQKPFVTDLDAGERLVELAEAQGVRLAVNQNGRFAPHFAWIMAAAQEGLLGEVCAVDCRVHWNHEWILGTPFEEVEQLVLFDFGIHWFDLVAALLAGRELLRVVASEVRAPGQRARPPLLAQAIVELEDGRATLAFDGASPDHQLDVTTVRGTRASVTSRGPDLQEQSLELHTPAGRARCTPAGRWFPTGFHGAMAELLSAVEEGREPAHSARENLRSLALCFAACESARRGLPVVPGTVRRLA